MTDVRRNRTVALFCLIALTAALAALVPRLRSSTTHASRTSPSIARMSAFPKLFLWAWERPERLTFINPREVGIAFLAQTIYMNGNGIVTRPRLQPLDIPAGTTLVAVVRIESSRSEKPSLSNEQRTEVTEALLQIARKQNISALQIDFDATQSERNFYRDLLGEVRRELPDSMPLSMTALASWCIFDNWLDDLPVDEAVPMLFQMGVDQHRITDYLNAGGKLRSSVCLQSVGVSTDETPVLVSPVRRVYVFNSKPWSEVTVRTALERSRNEIPIP